MLGGKPELSQLFIIHKLLLREASNLGDLELSGSDARLESIIQGSANQLLAEADRIIGGLSDAHPALLLTPLGKWYADNAGRVPLSVFANRKSLTRIVNVLRRRDIRELGQLMAISTEEILAIRFVGELTLAELLTAIEGSGYQLSPQKKEWLTSYLSR